MASRLQNEPQKFARDIIWVAISQILTNLFGVITLPMLTKTYSSETYGIWTQVNVTVAFVVPILTLQFGTSVVRFLAGEDNQIQRRRSLGTMLCAILIVGCLFLAIANLFASQLSIFLFNSPANAILVRLTSLWITSDALFLFFISYLRARGNIKQLSVLMVAMSAVEMVILVSLTKTGSGLETIVTGMVCTELFFTFGVLYLIVRGEGFPMLNFEGIRKFLAFSGPQIPTVIFGLIISTSDRYVITHFLNLSETGIYASSNMLGGLVALFGSPINFVLLPTISKAWEQNRKQDVKNYFEYSIKLFLTLAIPAATGLCILSQPLLKLLTTSEYMVGSGLVLLVAVGAIFSGIYGINVFIVYLLKQTKWLPLMIVAVSVTNVGLNLVLTPSIGIIGSAISNIISYFMLALIVFVWARKRFKYDVDFRYLGKVIAATLGMALCLHYLKVGGVSGIILSTIVGITVFSIILLLLRAFSDQDKRLIKQLFVR